LKEDRETFTSINVLDIVTWFEDQDDNIEISELNLNQLSILSKILNEYEKFDYKEFENESISLHEILSWDEDKIDTFLRINLGSLDVDYYISLSELEYNYDLDKDITKAILTYENSLYNYFSTHFEDAFNYCKDAFEYLNRMNYLDDENAHENISRTKSINSFLNDFNNKEYKSYNSSVGDSSDDL